MSYDVWLLLVGAGIGLVSSLLGAFVQHFLDLRAEQKKREWDRQEQARERLSAGSSASTLELLEELLRQDRVYFCLPAVVIASVVLMLIATWPEKVLALTWGLIGIPIGILTAILLLLISARRER